MPLSPSLYRGDNGAEVQRLARGPLEEGSDFELRLQNVRPSHSTPLAQAGLGARTGQPSKGALGKKSPIYKMSKLETTLQS